MSLALYRMGRQEHLIEVVNSSDKDQAYHYLLEFNAIEIPGTLSLPAHCGASDQAPLARYYRPAREFFSGSRY